MIKALFFGIGVLLVAAVIFNPVQAQAQNETIFTVGEVSLVKIGFRVFTSGDQLVQEDLYAVRIGDTSLAEAQSNYFGRFFADYSLNATLYVRIEEGENENWKAVTYRRPASDEEIVKFFENPPESFKRFYSEKPVKASELPAPADKLEQGELARIDFVIVYLTGGTKIYPVDGTTFEEAEALTRKIASLLERR